MTSTALHPITLDEFSQFPNLEESPAWEFFNGQVLQKPMPTFHHSCLQKRLVTAIDSTNSPYEAFPELRCILSQNSIVPDITVIHQSRIPTDNQPIQGAPNWLIEILSPVFLPDQPLRLLSGNRLLPVLNEMALELTPNQVFGWLQR